MPTPADTIREAVDELANESMRHQIRSAITIQDALTHTTDDVCMAFCQIAMSTQSPQSLLAEVIMERITDAEATMFLAGCLVYPQRAGETLANALRAHVADSLRQDAELAAENMEPSDGDLYGSYGRTPLDADRESLARSQNASVRIARMLE